MLVLNTDKMTFKRNDVNKEKLFLDITKSRDLGQCCAFNYTALISM